MCLCYVSKHAGGRFAKLKNCIGIVLNGLTDNKITIQVLGGEIVCEWDQEKNLVFMTGPATTVFEGEI